LSSHDIVGARVLVGNEVGKDVVGYGVGDFVVGNCVGLFDDVTIATRVAAIKKGRCNIVFSGSLLMLWCYNLSGELISWIKSESNKLDGLDVRRRFVLTLKRVNT